MTKSVAMVVDDDPILGQLFATALEYCGLEVEIIQDGRQSIAKMMERLPQLVILDMQMPHISGQEILHQIRAIEALAKVKVVIVTANAHTVQDDTLQELADLTLLKPVSLDQIKDFTNRLLHPTKPLILEALPPTEAESGK